MIAVIADDFTGAAEISGIGLQNGLKSVIVTEPEEKTDVDLLIVATDTRSLPPEQAAIKTESICQLLRYYDTELIFKKIDSVLRGNIFAEIKVQMEVLGHKRALIIAGNPISQRLIRDGIYMVNNIPLAGTFFKNDPSFLNIPENSSVVEIISKENNDRIFNFKATEKLPDEGIVIGDVLDNTDLDHWATKIDKGISVAGSSAFFNAVLKKLHYHITTYSGINSSHFGEHCLAVFGSTYPKNPEMNKRIREKNIPILNMPEEIYWDRDCDGSYFLRWADELTTAIHIQRSAIISCSYVGNMAGNIHDRIRNIMGLLVKTVIARVNINDLLIEGGATAFSICKYLGIARLFPLFELSPGIVKMRAGGYPELLITTKPGSYQWPQNIWDSISNQQIITNE